jgi:hypothetical protein
MDSKISYNYILCIIYMFIEVIENVMENMFYYVIYHLKMKGNNVLKSEYQISHITFLSPILIAQSTCI